MASGLGGLIGGLGTGAAVDRWGFPTMLAGLALFVALWPLSSLLLREVRTPRSKATPAAPSQAQPPSKAALGRGFWLLTGASLASGCANFIGILGRSIAMNSLAFSAIAIASVAAISAAVGMPLMPLFGRLSDRLGRRGFLIAGYLLYAASLVVLLFSTALWHFGVASILISLALSLSSSVGSAWITDLVSRGALGRAMSLSGATGWVAGILGFMGGGQAIQRLGTAPAYGIGVGLMIVALGLAVSIRRSGRQAERGLRTRIAAG